MADSAAPEPGSSDGGAAAVVRYGYDAEGRIETISRSGAPTLNLRCDDRGRLSQLTRGDHDERFHYDRRGALAGLDEPGGHWTMSSDPIERRRAVTYPGGEVVVQQWTVERRIERVEWVQGRHVLAYTRDLFGQTIAIETPAGTFKVHRDRANRRITREYPNGALAQFDLNRHGRATRILHATPDRRVFQQFEYRYDDRLRLIEARDSGPQGTVTTGYRYDAYGQLLAADRSDGAQCRYTYDRFGNLTLLHEHAHEATMTFGGADRLVTFNGSTVEHEEDGNLTSLNGSHFEHDFRRRLTRRGATRHEHSALGVRLAVHAPGAERRFLHVHGTVPRVLVELGAGTTRYLWDDEGLLGQIDGTGAVLYFFEDQLGSIRAAMDANGRVIAEADYTPFGTPIRRIPGVRFGFAGEEQDDDGLVHLRARTYEPRIGRFLSKDPLPPRLFDIAKQNRYAYAANAPTNYVDRSGMQAEQRFDPLYYPDHTIATDLPTRAAKGEILNWTNDSETLQKIITQYNGYYYDYISSLDIPAGQLPSNAQVRVARQYAFVQFVTDNALYPKSAQRILIFNAQDRAFPPNTVTPSNLGLINWDWLATAGHFTASQFTAVDSIGLSYIIGKPIWNLIKNYGNLLDGLPQFNYEFLPVQDQLGIAAGELLRSGAIGIEHLLDPKYRADLDRILPDQVENLMNFVENGAFVGMGPYRPDSFLPPLEPGPANRSPASQGTNEVERLTHFILGAMRDAEQAIAQHPVSGGPGQVAGPGGYARPEAYEAVAAFKAMRAQQVPAVGGVWLAQAAEAIGSLAGIEGASFDAASERLLLVGPDGRSAALPGVNPEHLAVAMANVFGSGTEEPGVTIDPSPDDPLGPRMPVRYFGGVSDTAFGLTLFEADRVMKSLSLGEDNLTQQAIGVAVPGYRNLATLSLGAGPRDPGRDLWSRFWLVPERVLVQSTADRRSISFPDTRIAVRTETMRWRGGKLVPAGGDKDPKAEQFATHFSEHYGAYAAEHPVFRELENLANLVGLAKWLRQAEVPVDLDWVSRYLRTAPTPATTPSHRVVREQAAGDGVTQRISVFGGVDLSVRNHPVADDDSATQEMARDALRAVSGQRGVANVVGTVAGRERRRIVALPTSRARAPEAALLAEDELLLVPRIFCSAHNEPGPFGHAWALDLPSLRIGLPDKSETRWVMVGTQKVTLREFRLVRPFGLTDVRFRRHVFDAERERLAFVPERGGEGIRALYPEADDARFRVEFTNGLVRTFDADGALVGTTYRGITLHYRRDAADRLESIELARDGTARCRIVLAHDALGRICSAETPAGRVDYHYDAASDLVLVARADRRTEYRYDDRHLVTRVAVDGRQTASFALDTLGAVTARDDPDVGAQSARIATADHGLAVARQVAGVETLRRYDGGGRLIESQLPSGRVLRATYDAQGRTAAVSATDRFGDVSRIHVDADGRRLVLHNAANDEVELRLDDFGRLLQVQAGGRPRISMEHLRTTTGWMEAAETPSLRASRRLDAQGRVLEWLLSAANPAAGQLRLTTRHGPGTAGTTTQIDADGLVSARWNIVDGRLRTQRVGADATDYAYDPYGRLTRIASADATLEITRAADGSLRRSEARQGTCRCDIDYRAGAPVQRTFGDGRTDRFDYDGHGRLTSVESSDGDAWSLERSDHELSLRRAGALQWRFRFDEAGRVVEFAD